MKKVDYEHFGRFVYPCNLSAHGRDLYLTVKRADFDDNDYKSDLYRIRGGVTERLTSAGDVKSYVLTDRGVVFPSARDKKDKQAQKDGKPLTVFQLLPYEGGEARELMRLDYRVNDIVFIDEDRFFFTAEYSHEYAAALAEAQGDADKAAKRVKEDADYHVVDELPFRFNGAGYVNKTRSRLYLWDKGEVRALSDEFTDVSIMGLSDDKSRLLYTVARYTDMREERDTLLMLDTAAMTALDVSASDNASHYKAFFMPDGDLIVVASVYEKYGLNENPKVFRCSFKNRTKRMICGDGESCFGNSVGSDVKMGRTIPAPACVRGEEFFFLNTLDDSGHIMSLDAGTGEVRRITDRRGSVNEFVLWQDGFAAIAMRGLDGCEVYGIGLDGAEQRLSDFNTALSAEYETSAPVDVFYENAEGVVIHGFIIPPVGRVEGKKYPAILDIHGGPKTVYGNCYFHEMQLWAGMGYAVVFCNPTGGDGRGDAFADIRGGYGTTDYTDIMGFLDKVVAENDFIDGDRLGVTGGSYGGFMTNWIIGHTDRFKAAASQRSISNWVSFYGCSDIGPMFAKDQTSGTPWDGLERMWEQSPLKYADRVTTPTLFIHSDEDYRCPLPEGMQMFTALKTRGVPARMCIFKGENHELSRSGKPKHRVRRLKEITEWFERYIGAGSEQG